MITRKSAFTIEADIHGMTVSEAKKALEKLLNTADSTIKEIDVIHGYSNGQALQNMVRKNLKHKRIAAKILSLNQGITTLKLDAK
ncbi:MAG TPA: Smr/MutS family protein [Oscillospiraceae bacterium]|nr:Smr/MutS family protein [Oscillospiraceae bacterium]